MAVPNPPPSSGLADSDLPSIDEISRFLREAVVDDESAQLRASLQGLATALEALTARGLHQGDRLVMAARLAELQQLLQQHQLLVDELNPAWQGLYEYRSYVAALQHFGGRVQTWLRDLAAPHRPTVWFADFELLSWRLLGAGTLLLDAREQWGGAEPDSVPADALDTLPQPAGRRWWQRLKR